MEKVTITHAEPGPAHFSRYDWYAIAQAAKDASGEWIRLDEPVNSAYASQINHGSLKAFRPEGEYEAVVRNRNVVKQNCSELYIRWVGGETHD